MLVDASLIKKASASLAEAWSVCGKSDKRRVPHEKNEALLMYGDALGTQTCLAQLRFALSADDGLSASIQGF